jgi:hypothetical protein
MATTTPWLDLSAYGLRLQVIAAPDGRAVLYMAGSTDAHRRALIALGFQRTPNGYMIKPDGKLTAAAALAQFPAARLQDWPLADVVRRVSRNAPARPEPSPSTPPVETPTATGQWRITPPQDLLDALTPLVQRAAHGERLDSTDLQPFAARLEAPGNPEGLTPGVLHQLQEALEVAAVRAIMPTLQAVQAALRVGQPLPEAAFSAAVTLTENLPRQRYRSERTVQLAQYSTPLPLALAAQALLGPVGAGRTVLEPAAGHGVLVCGLPADVAITAIEHDPARMERLRQALPTIQVVSGDALQVLDAGEPHYDYVIANPPFGRLPPTLDQSRTTVTVAGTAFTTQRLDHALLLHSLRQRHPEGRAVFILAAEHPRDHALERPEGGSRYLFNFLADHFHVEAVIGLQGDLYRVHGAHYPVRLVVIGAHGPGFAPVPETVPVVATWEALWRTTQELCARLGPSQREQRAPVTAPGEPIPPAATASRPPEGRTSDPLDVNPTEDEAVVYQVRYTARSRVGEPITMIPANMALASRRALDRVEQQSAQSVDAFVADALGRSMTDLAAAFSPEQVDALALALYAFHQGRGFIEADETGIGKGRVLAGLTQWAWRQQRPVLFLTEKANLFSDFYRDLAHTGGALRARPVILNEGVAIKDTERGHTLLRPTLAGELRRWIEAGVLPPECNLVLATYSQINRPWSQCAKARWLRAIAEREQPLVIADESHNAAGSSNTFENVRALIAAASGVVFSSATYAKRPDNFELYAPVLPTPYRRDPLTELLQAGGAPLQEVFSQMLAEDGVLVRREHDLSQIMFHTAPDPRREARNRELADRLAGLLEQMAYLGGDIQAMITEENQRWAEALDDADERRGARAGLQAMHFGSRLYQLNRLFLLALKVDHAVEFGLEALQAGRKPVFVLEHTLETLLREVITNRFDEQTDTPLDHESPEPPAITMAHPASATLPLEDDPPEHDPARLSGSTLYPVLHFRDALHRMLDRMMMLTRRDRYGGATQEPIQSPELWELHAHIHRQIVRFPDLELSPLDRIRQALEQHGYRCGELSGRSFGLHFTTDADGAPRMAVQPRPAEDRSDLIFRFNTDQYHALLLTRSGATGLSLHARNDVPGWSPAPRSLFELQIPQNVAERIQFWGRVNRRGQCAPPTVVTPTTGLPGEVRLIAMQNAKLRQLSANTTSSQDNAALARAIPDLLNVIGNRIARDWAAQNPVDALRLDATVSKERDGMPLWYVNRVMSRILLLAVDQQERLLDQWSGNFAALLEHYHSQGLHPFRTAEADWRATVVHQQRFEGGVTANADSVFLAPIDYTTVQYEERLNPLSGERVQRLLDQGASHYDADATGAEFAAVQAQRLHQAIQPHGRFAGVATLEEGLTAPDENPVKTVHRALQVIADFLNQVKIGATLDWYEARSPTENTPANGADAENTVLRRGQVVDIDPPLEKGAHLAGQYLVRLALPGEPRLVTRSIYSLHQADYAVSATPLRREDFDRAERGIVQRRRHLLTGNLYAALQLATRENLGRPQLFTDVEGQRQRGVLLHADYTLTELRDQPVLLRGPAVLAACVAHALQERPLPLTVLIAQTEDGGHPLRFDRRRDFVLDIQAEEVRLTVPGAHARNAMLLDAKAWLTLPLSGAPLAGDRATLTMRIEPVDRAAVLTVLGETFAWYAPAQYRDWYNRHQESPTPPGPERRVARQEPASGVGPPRP